VANANGSDMCQMPRNITLRGYGISSGLAMGRAWIYHDILQRMQDVYAIEADEIEGEYRRIQDAFGQVLQDLETSEREVQEKLDEEFARIFRAHRAILRDPSLLEEIRERLERSQVNAEFVVMAVFRRLEGRFRRSLNDDRWAERADDVADLAKRVLRFLTGQAAHQLADLSPNTILVASRLLPSDTVHFSREAVSAVVVERGGPASHAAILTRELGIPAVSGVENAIQTIPEERIVLVDGAEGTVVIDPDEQLQQMYHRRRTEIAIRRTRASSRTDTVARTREGTEIAVRANISGPEEAALAVEHGADGVGLYRIESMYFGREDLPSEDELVDALRETLSPFDVDQSVTLRLLDIGGDKPLPFLDHPKEPTPVLGRRGVRLLLAFPDLLRMQLRSFLRLSMERSTRVLVPMVTLASDMQALRDVYLQVVDEVSCPSPPPLGSMVETPAAALCVEALLEHSDFFSVGTNDLTQYTMAAGRENAHVEEYFLQDHPAIFRLLGCMMNAAGDRPVGVCGELASQTDVTGRLLAMGVRELSVSPLQVPHVKQAVREVCLDEVPSDPKMEGSVR